MCKGKLLVKRFSICVSCKESSCYAAVIDLGLACEEGHEECKETAGTPGYIAPEALEAGGSGRPVSDVFSLGVVLYRLLYAKPPPFLSDRLGIQTRLYHPSQDPNFQGVRTQRDELALAMLTPDPEFRISIADVLTKLRDIIEMEGPPQEVLAMLSIGPVQRGAKNPFPRCLFEQSVGNVKDVQDLEDKPFHRLDCTDLPKSAPFKCGFCFLCNPCCQCRVKRHGVLVPEFFRMESCQ